MPRGEILGIRMHTKERILSYVKWTLFFSWYSLQYISGQLVGYHSIDMIGAVN